MVAIWRGPVISSDSEQSNGAEEDGEVVGALGTMGSLQGGKRMRNGAGGFYARMLSVPRGEKKGIGAPGEQRMGPIAAWHVRRRGPGWHTW
jgi:hypothetical protein